ncbi:DNA fragmentation factor subunit alpha [Microtus ochrogaster]|uniref:DNAation factor subunit alpha n=1 Tax=Microtus ochrogaster TaxID=79684 RepID=A0A8J6G0G8_MICOH|nr:DNA fragmentation factor subunit alpha [Microtus ochrogaster]
MAASCLEELSRKVLAIDESLTPVTLVLAEDNSIVDDDDYFLYVPCNTKFVALACNEKGSYNNSDGGTSWVSQESFDAHETDRGAGVKWKSVARQLKEDLPNIILLSEEDLQQMLELYHWAKEKVGAIFSNQEEPKAALGGDMDVVDTGISKEMAFEVALTSQILTAEGEACPRAVLI